MADSILERYHKIRRIQKGMGHRLKAVPRSARPNYPHFLEEVYKAKLYKRIDELWAKVKPILEKHVPLIIKQAITQGIPQRDEWTDEFTAMEELLEASYGDFLEEEELAEMTAEMGSMVSKFNGKDLARVLAVIGGTHALEESWVNPHVESFVKENVNLIKSIGQDNHSQVKNLILRGIRGGYRSEEILKGCEKRFDISKSRAKMIARDQVSKFNGDLSKVRQVHAGIKTYEWDTAHDERVRGRPGGLYPRAIPSHWIMQGLVCQWDDPSVYLRNGVWVPRTALMPKEHPSEPILCRCVPLPNFDEDDPDED